MRDSDFERLYEDQAQALFGFLAYRTGDRALAEDLMGEAFERALHSRGRYDPAKASAKTWLYAIALNCLRDQRRRAEAEARALDRAGAGSEPAAPDRGLGRGEPWRRSATRSARRWRCATAATSPGRRWRPCWRRS
jgi:RNA polymerase sigma factor (sigma-70 family)